MRRKKQLPFPVAGSQHLSGEAAARRQTGLRQNTPRPAWLLLVQCHGHTGSPAGTRHGHSCHLPFPEPLCPGSDKASKTTRVSQEWLRGSGILDSTGVLAVILTPKASELSDDPVQPSLAPASGRPPRPFFSQASAGRSSACSVGKGMNDGKNLPKHGLDRTTGYVHVAPGMVWAHGWQKAKGTRETPGA